MEALIENVVTFVALAGLVGAVAMLPLLWLFPGMRQDIVFVVSVSLAVAGP